MTWATFGKITATVLLLAAAGILAYGLFCGCGKMPTEAPERIVLVAVTGSLPGLYWASAR